MDFTFDLLGEGGDPEAALPWLQEDGGPVGEGEGLSASAPSSAAAGEDVFTGTGPTQANPATLTGRTLLLLQPQGDDQAAEEKDGARRRG